MIVYCATNQINGKRYVGVTAQPLARRISQHLSRAGRLPVAFSHALAKYGPSAFEWGVVAECADRSAMLAAEAFYIRQLNTLADGGHGYNRNTGGTGVAGLSHTQESRDRMSKTRRRAAFARNQAGRQTTLFDRRIGRRHSLEHVEKIRDSMRGKFNARKLDPSLAPAFRERLAMGETKTSIAVSLGVHPTTVSLFLKRNGS